MNPPTSSPQKTARISTQTQAFGPIVLPNNQGVRFQLWAPSAKQVSLVLPTNNSEPNRTLPMQSRGNGWYQLEVPDLSHGVLYQFQVDTHWLVPDPASRYQPQDAHGPSQIIDWSQRPSARPEWTGRPWEEVVIYELHVGSFSPEGTFQGVQAKLDYLLDLGVTAIELMPIADFPGQRNWGYDGVLPFAPDSAYGTPEDLKALIDAAHEKGLMVFLDVVCNHFGPDGNYLHVYAKPFFNQRCETPWGAAINFENQPEVRQFFIENALYWLNDYGFDGLRFDAVHAIYDASSPHFLEALADSIHQHIAPDRQVHLMLENDKNQAQLIDAGKQTQPISGFTAQWNDDFHHAAHVIATGETDGYYEDYADKHSAKSAVAHFARCLAEGFAYQGEPSYYRNQAPRGEKSAHLSPAAFINFLQNHDQIGNRAFGDRLTQTTAPDALKALLTCLLLAPSIPLLFMGEEWGTKKPFQYFCDFEGELAQQVTEGRRREFAKFPAFADAATRQGTPDPCAPETFENARLDWSELTRDSHLEWLKFYKHLLLRRKERIVPLISRMLSGNDHDHAYKVFETSGIQVQWTLSNGGCLQLTANLAAEPLTAPPSILHNLSKVGLERIESSQPLPLKILETGQIPAWFVIWQTG